MHTQPQENIHTEKNYSGAEFSLAVGFIFGKSRP